MLKTYFKIAWRNIVKSPFYSVVNIVGLSVGIAFTLLIAAYVWGELQVNGQLKNPSQQYIILSKWKDPNMGNEIVCIAPLPKALKDNYPKLIANYYHADGITTTVSSGDKHFRENLQLGDSTLLNMYGLKLLHGDPNTALNDPYSVVLAAKMAQKYFGKTDVVGQTLNFESFDGQRHDFTISGVLDELPKNSVTALNDANNFFFNVAAARYFKRKLDGWDNVGTIDYIELQPGVAAKTVEKAMKSLINQYEGDKVIKTGLTPILVKLGDYNLLANGGLIKKMAYTLFCIALFILAMAIINFVNICIGRSSGRMKEIGVRKVLGSVRKQIIWQFLTESTLIVAIATIIALSVYLFARPYFSAVLGSELISLWSIPVYVIPVLILFVLTAGLLAGVYPAFILSAVNTAASLKGKLNTVKEHVLLRSALVAFQFIIATVVSVGAVVISQQVNLFFGNNLGYDKGQVIYAPVPRDWSARGVQKMAAVRTQLSQISSVRDVTLSYEIPNGRNGGNYLVYRQGAKTSEMISTTGLVTDGYYATTYNIPIKAGAFFKPVFNPADSTQIVINETQAKALGWKKADDAIGQKIIIPAYGLNAYTICGVTTDFHFGSLQEKIGPVTFMNVNYATNYRYFSIKLTSGNLQASLSAIQKKWNELLPGAPFDFKFIDDALANMYKSELQLKKAAYLATILATVIVLLGVLGLISLNVQKRTKEIGIRKVLGSSVTGISALFLKDTLIVVLVSGLVACPVAWLAMQHWLADYAYKVSLTATPFLASVAVLTLATALIITLQTIKAAYANPVDSLRSE